MPKRPAPSSPPATAAKKVKAAAGSKVAKAGKAASKPAKSTLAAVAESVKRGAKKVAAEIETVVENAGDLLIDDVAPAAEKPKKAGKKTVTETVKKGAKKAAADVSTALDNAGELLIDDVAPDVEASKKGKKVAAPAAARGTKRKSAEDFMDKAEKVVVSVTEKVGSALGDVVREFGEASGLIEKKDDGKKAKAAKASKTDKSEAEAKPTKKAATEKKAASEKTEKAAKSKGKKVAEPAPEPESDAEGSNASFIGAFESDDEMGGADSSDDESDDEEAAVAAAGRQVDVTKLPASKDDKSVAARLKKASKKKGVERGTLYLGRIPHGFYEEQMKEYFNQFGDVTRLRLARNPKTGASRHYGYIEFSSAPVAEIVAETMNHYLLMGHLLRCNIIPADEVHPELWVGANKKWRMVPRARLEKVRQDKPRTKEQQDRANSNVLKRQDSRRQKIKAAGIDYDFEGHK